MMEVEMVVTTGAIRRAKLQSNHHQSPPTNQHPNFYRPDTKQEDRLKGIKFNQLWTATEGKYKGRVCPSL